MGTTLALFHSCGIDPEQSDRLRIWVSGKEMNGAAIFPILADRPSSPVALLE